MKEFSDNKKSMEVLFDLADHVISNKKFLNEVNENFKTDPIKPFAFCVIGIGSTGGHHIVIRVAERSITPELLCEQLEKIIKGIKQGQKFTL